MPTYEYECPSCKRRIEKVQRISQRLQVPSCPNCGKSTERVMTAPSVHFKGRGWTPQYHGMVNGGEE